MPDEMPKLEHAYKPHEVWKHDRCEAVVDEGDRRCVCGEKQARHMNDKPSTEAGRCTTVVFRRYGLGTFICDRPLPCWEHKKDFGVDGASTPAPLGTSSVAPAVPTTGLISVDQLLPPVARGDRVSIALTDYARARLHLRNALTVDAAAKTYLAKHAALNALATDDPKRPEAARDLADAWLELNAATKET